VSAKVIMRRATITLRFACCMFALLLVSCGGTPGEQQTVDGLTIGLERPDKVALLENYTYTVTLSDASGNPVEGATVYLEQDMPAMPMGSNQPLGEPLGGGKYQIKSVFTMEGDWVVKIHASVAGKDHVATFEQKVELPQ
jgi:hypothetical protein